MCGAVARFCVVCCAVCCSGARCRPVVKPLRVFSALPPAPAAWSPVVASCLGSVLGGCCVVLLCRLPCGVLLFALFLPGAALLLRLRWLVPSVVACGYWVFVAWSGCPLLFPFWRALLQLLLPGFMACCPAVCSGSLWRPAPLCCVHTMAQQATRPDRDTGDNTLNESTTAGSGHERKQPRPTQKGREKREATPGTDQRPTDSGTQNKPTKRRRAGTAHYSPAQDAPPNTTQGETVQHTVSGATGHNSATPEDAAPEQDTGQRSTETPQ